MSGIGSSINDRVAKLLCDYLWLIANVSLYGSIEQFGSATYEKGDKIYTTSHQPNLRTSSQIREKGKESIGILVPLGT